MSQEEFSIRIDQRFDILREVIADYRLQVQKMESEVVELFASDQLSAISERIREKQRIVRLIQHLEQFVDYWEAASDSSID